jgi:hypothetical protein
MNDLDDSTVANFRKDQLLAQQACHIAIFCPDSIQQYPSDPLALEVIT